MLDPKVLLFYVLICGDLVCPCASGDMMTMQREKVEKTKFWNEYYEHAYQDVVAAKRSRARSSGPWSNASCVEGMAGGVYHCHLIDLLGFIALEDMGCGYTYD